MVCPLQVEENSLYHSTGARRFLSALAEGCRQILGREWAGTRPAPTVVTADGFAARRKWVTGGIDSTPATRRQCGMVLGRRCGGTPPAQGRAKGPNAQLQRSVVRGDGACPAWRRESALAQSLPEAHESSPPIIDCTLAEWSLSSRHADETLCDIVEIAAREFVAT